MGLHFASVLFLLSGLCPVFLSEQDVPAASGQVEHAPLPPSGHPPIVFPERPVSWQKLLPNLARDQKDIWLFPISRAVEHHLKPALVLTAITAGTIAAVDVPSGKYFQRTRSFDGFNRAFSGKNTSVVMFAAPSVFYGISLLRKDSYAQHTFLLAGEAVMSSEVLTTVMKDVDRRMKPFEVPLREISPTRGSEAIPPASCGASGAFLPGTPFQRSPWPRFSRTAIQIRVGMHGSHTVSLRPWASPGFPNNLITRPTSLLGRPLAMRLRTTAFFMLGSFGSWSIRMSEAGVVNSEALRYINSIEKSGIARTFHKGQPWSNFH